MATDQLWSDYFHYDRRVDIVSVAEVWFTRAAGLSTTVKHFDRFPRIAHSDGHDATPDFTVLFSDDTALIGELANLSLRQESLDSLAAQLQRYNTLLEVPAGRRTPHGIPMQSIAKADVVLLSPIEVANYACDRLAAAAEDPEHPYSPGRMPMVLGYSFDPDQGAYTFTRPTRARNELLEDYGRRPSLSSWLTESADTLRGLPAHFAAIKAAARFMNDSPPALYTATVLWGTLLPTYVAEHQMTAPVDLTFTVDELVERMRRDYGVGQRSNVVAALDFLNAARVASEGPRNWRIHYRDLGSIDRDISQALLHQFRSRANKTRPIRTAEPGAQPPAEPPVQEPLFNGERT